MMKHGDFSGKTDYRMKLFKAISLKTSNPIPRKKHPSRSGNGTPELWSIFMNLGTISFNPPSPAPRCAQRRPFAFQWRPSPSPRRTAGRPGWRRRGWELSRAVISMVYPLVI